MASRLGLGRVIAWAKDADIEEVHFALHRLTQIAQERIASVDREPPARKTRRTKSRGQMTAEPTLEGIKAAGAD